MGFYHDGQAGLELLTSGDPLTLASQSARITGVSHSARQFLSWFINGDSLVKHIYFILCCLNNFSLFLNS